MSTKSKCVVDSYAVRSPSGAIGVAEPKFTTGWLSADQTRICDEVVIDAALKILAEQLVRGDRMDSPQITRSYLTLRFAGLEHEVFCCLWLDGRQRVIACDELSRGTIDGASVHPREVVKQALARNAAGVIFAHNHPSGVAEPSQADELITCRLKDALAIVDIRVLDHLIVAGARCASMVERGLL
jgi:DNA repair protein RadC